MCADVISINLSAPMTLAVRVTILMASATPLPMSPFNIAATRSLSCNIVISWVGGGKLPGGFAVA
jgi:hypothetical protein